MPTGKINLPCVKTPTLLWTNSAPTASFAAQTIQLDLSGYKAIIFQYHNFASNNSNYALMSCFCIKGDTTHAGVWGISTNIKNGVREIGVSDSGVSVGNCTWGGDTTNTYMIPYKIYGLRW